MRIVVSGTHASGKSTLIADFVAVHPEYEVLPDPFEELMDEGFDDLDSALFSSQLVVAARRLLLLRPGSRVIAERGPLDFLAYLEALETLGRRGRSAAAFADGLPLVRAAAPRIDLLVLLPLTRRDTIRVGDDEDPELRLAMNDTLLDLADDPDLTGATVIEVTGDRAARLAQLEQGVST